MQPGNGKENLGFLSGECGKEGADKQQRSQILPAPPLAVQVYLDKSERTQDGEIQTDVRGPRNTESQHPLLWALLGRN